MHRAQSTTIGENTAYLVHEVNQPLAAILLNAKAALRWLARDPPNYEEARRCLECVVGNGRRAADIARHVRDQLREAPSEMTSVDINDVIIGSLDLTGLVLNRNGVVVETDLAEDLAEIWGDRVQLEGLAVNLIANAVEAMRTVDDRDRELRISTQSMADGHVLVTVEDAGTGIDPAKIDRIFDPYFTTKSEGLGLGLSICRSIVEEHGGQLWVASRLPHGTIFSFSIPPADQARGQDDTERAEQPISNRFPSELA